MIDFTEQEKIRKTIGVGQTYWDRVATDIQQEKAKNWVKNGVALNVRRNFNTRVVGHIYIDLDNDYKDEIINAHHELERLYGKDFILTHD